MAEKPLKDRYIKVNDINIRYWAAGDEGPAIILIHGLGRSLESWQYNIDAFSDKFQVYALDLVGFGRSDRPLVPYSVPFLAHFVRDFLAGLGIKSATIIGNSMGGAIALHMAFSNPQIIEKLVLVDPVGFGTWVHLGIRLATAPFIGECLTHPNRISTHYLLQKILFDKSLITDEMIDSELEIAALPGTRNALLATGRSFLGVLGVKRGFVKHILTNVHRLRCRTLVIWGKQDRILPVSQAHRASKVIPDANLELFDACGHVPQLERPKAFNARVMEFLAG